jgi:serine/threonine protein kinase/Tol biopolymer transport system component
MFLRAGTRLGPYEIVASLGAGGMGEVYRARDVRLDRQVAIKVLPDRVVGDADRLARFEREARVLATLNHPLIAQVYGFEQSGDTGAIVMELVEGPTLEERIAQGPLAAADALRIARQIAEALESAHDLGIVHRDLKPANIKLRLHGAPPLRTADGRLDRPLAPADLEECTVKVLDFGLAKAVDQMASADPLNSPTLTARATELGTILGTAAYMAPEQARGKPVDKRADVWAFGVVLYEMLTGTRLFKGEDVSDTMAAVLRQPIVLTSLPDGTPAAVAALLERCLERDPRQRLRDIGEARIALGRMLTSPAGSEMVASPSPRPPAPSRARTVVPWLMFAIAVVALIATLLRDRSSPTTRPPAVVTRLSVGIGVPGTLAVDSGPAAVLSPDGRTIVLRVRNDTTTRLYVRRLDQLTPVELAGSENAASHFFSPDGKQIGFFASGGLKTMPLAGGAATTLTDAAAGRGAAWDQNGDILFQSSLFFRTPLVRITAAGAVTDRGTALAPDEATHRWPQILPGGRVLYSGHTDVSNWDSGTLRVETTPGVPGKIVLRGGYYGRYVPTGHLLYVHGGTLYGVRFDLEQLVVTSSAVPIVEGIAATHISGSAQYSFGSDGTLAYVPGNPTSVDARIHWMTPGGETSALKTTPGAWGNPRFSPNGKQIAMQVAYGSHDHIAIYDIASDRLTQLTFDAANHRSPLWTPDGRRIVYSSDASGGSSQNVYWRNADGTGEAQRLTTSPGHQVVAGIHPNGRMLLYSETNGGPPGRLWLLPLQGSHEKGWTAGTPRALGDGKVHESAGVFSPDGRVIAYVSTAVGGFEIFVKPLEGAGGPWRVSTGGGAHPAWSKASGELLFTTEDRIMTARYRYDGQTFTAETPRPWSTVPYTTGGPTRKFDLHPDGKRVIVAGPNPAGAAPYDKVVFVVNFFAELERLLPAAR